MWCGDRAAETGAAGGGLGVAWAALGSAEGEERAPGARTGITGENMNLDSY